MAVKPKPGDPRICIWCGNEIEHSFTIPLCIPCLVRIHHETTDRGFDANKPLQEYLAEKRGKKDPIPFTGEPPDKSQLTFQT